MHILLAAAAVGVLPGVYCRVVLTENCQASPLTPPLQFDFLKSFARKNWEAVLENIAGYTPFIPPNPQAVVQMGGTFVLDGDKVRVQQRSAAVAVI